MLTDVGITDATLSRYVFAVGRLKDVLEVPSTLEELDEVLTDWIQTEFEDGSPLYMVGDALSGLHHFMPFTKKKLTSAWRLYSIWRRFEVPCRAPPVPQDILVAMAGRSLRKNDLEMAGLLLLGFHCLLRTGEILQVRPCDFILGPTSGLVTLASSKSGVRNNSKESVAIHDPITLETMRTLLELKRQLHLQNVPCWSKSGSAFRDTFNRLLHDLQIADLQFRPYSLRRGGATWEMQQHGQMERTLLRGRWRNSNVARIYLCDGLALLPTLKMTSTAKALVLVMLCCCLVATDPLERDNHHIDSYPWVTWCRFYTRPAFTQSLHKHCFYTSPV